MIFSLALVPLVMAAGGALDYSTATNVRSKLQTAGDAAAVAGDAVTPWSIAACRDAAEKYFKNNVSTAHLSVVPNPSVNCTQSGTTVTVEGKVKTTLLGVVGLKSIDVGILSRTTCQSSSSGPGGEPDHRIWYQPGSLPNMTRIVTLGEFNGPQVRYRMTPEGHPIVRLDNPHDGPATITIRSVPNSPVGNMSFSLPHGGRFIVIIPWIPTGTVSWFIHDGPHPRNGGTATWSNVNRLEWLPSEIPGTPIFESTGDRHCWISQ